MENIGGLFLAALLVLPLQAGAKPTRLCNTSSVSQIVLMGTPQNARVRIIDAVNHPEQDPDLYDRLWRPLKVSGDNPYYYASDSVYLDFDPVQDVVEMVAAMRVDPVIAMMGIRLIAPNTGICFSAGPPGPRQIVTEYHNTTLDHYFLSSSAEENAYIDAGGAGPGWVRTGESFRTYAPTYCFGGINVFRFYGKGPNSHFFTPDAIECGGLRTRESGWQVEGAAFGATSLPKNGACEYPYLTPVYRLYNNRWMFNDSNHRYTIRTDIYQQMIGKGWIGEGVAFCVYNTQ